MARWVGSRSKCLPLLFSFGDGGKAWLIKEETFIKASDPTTVVLLICARYTYHRIFFLLMICAKAYIISGIRKISAALSPLFVGRERPPRLSPERFFPAKEKKRLQPQLKLCYCCRDQSRRRRRSEKQFSPLEEVPFCLSFLSLSRVPLSYSFCGPPPPPPPPPPGGLGRD